MKKLEGLPAKVLKKISAVMDPELYVSIVDLGLVYDVSVKKNTAYITMTLTTIIALAVGLIFSTADILREIFTIILIALVIDIFTTYLTNMGIIKWYCDKKRIQ